MENTSGSSGSRSDERTERELFVIQANIHRYREMLEGSDDTHNREELHRLLLEEEQKLLSFPQRR
jgi:hypothetical protein